jgi:iron complex transport system permease protein
MLAAGGGAYQGVFRNPLADPYLLGVAAGAGMGATISIAYGPTEMAGPIDPLPLLAFVGALAAVAATYVLGAAGEGRARSSATIVLAGVAVASFFTAVQTYVQQREVEDLRQVWAWTLGGLATSGWSEVRLVLPYVAVAVVVLLTQARMLDALRVGEDEATTLGVDAVRVRFTVVLAATFGTAAVVAVSGLIGFVGIIVPHGVRLLAGGSYRRVLPLSLLFGAAFLVFTDLLARMLESPAELPIGVVTAFFGAPFFVVVLRTRNRAR